MNSSDHTKTLMTINTGLLVVIALYLFFWGQPPVYGPSSVPASFYPNRSPSMSR